VELYLISPPEKQFIDRLEPLLSLGVDWFQYRRPNYDDQTRYSELRDVKLLTDQYETRLVVNDRPDLALTVGADAVHLGDDDLPVEAVKSDWPGLTVGRTQRSDDSPHEQADYLSVGPVFSTYTKSVGREPCGWKPIKTFLELTRKPVYAIGGITPERLKNVPAQLAGIAVVSAIWDHENPAEVLEEFSRHLGS
jgi:thiamine-phosphate pyrophosphorylase